MSHPPPPTPSTILAYVVVLVLSVIVARRWIYRSPAAWPLLVFLALLTLGFGLAYNSFLPDDSYITYRYARNLLEGHGLVYNPGERVLSTTTPLYTLLLAAAGLVWPDLPTTSHVLSLPALFAGALVLYLLLARHGKAVAGLVLAVLYILNPLIAAVYSSESILHVALIFAAICAYDRDRWEWAAVWAALAVVNRGDGALVAVALGIHWLVTGRWREGWRRPLGAAAIYLAVSLPWYLFSWLYYGSMAPATMSAKMAQGLLPNARLFGPGLVSWWQAYARAHPFYWLLLPAALVTLGHVLFRARNRWVVPVVLWAGLYAAGYTLLRVTQYQNYYTPLAPALLLLAVAGADTLGLGAAALLARRASLRSAEAPRSRLSLPGARAMLVIAFGLLVGLAFWSTGSELYPRLPQPRVVIYEEIGRWLRENTPPGATVGMVEVGTMGYYADRHVIDFYGLIQPVVSEHMARNELTWASRHFQPDYMVLFPPTLGIFVGFEEPWFAQGYAPIKTFENQRCVELRANCSPFVVYARK